MIRTTLVTLLLAVPILDPLHPRSAFLHLAVSQVGYGPSMTKEFTSPQSFTSFRVVSEADGSIAFSGGPPTRKIQTGILGAVSTVWIGDFSPLAVSGRYRIEADNGRSSYPFDVGADVFDRAIRAVQRWFYYQRAFTGVERPYAEGPWTHASDADKAPPGTVKGWHDAGDLTVYNASTSAALFWLLEAFSDFAPQGDDTNIPESGNGIPDLLDEARWGLEWLLSQQGDGGGFRSTSCQREPAHYGLTTPNTVAHYTAGEVGTIATARAVGTLAYASTVFRPFDGPFADRCLRAARNGDLYLAEHARDDTDGPSCPSYRADGNRVVGRQVRMYAAAGMLLATGEPRFRDAFERCYEEIRHIPDYNNVNGFAARLYLRAPAGDPARKRALRQAFRSLADAAISDGMTHPFHWATYYYWGSISNGFHRTGTFNVWECLEKSGGGADCDQALANVHYALGRNYYQFCFVSGLPGVTVGMTRGFHQWLKALDATPHDFPGMVAGGPNQSPDPNDRSYPSSRPFATWGYWGDHALPRDASTPLDGRYTDNDSWSTNEVAVNWQAAALYNLYFAQRMAKGRASR